MKLSLNNEADVFASLQNTRSITTGIAELLLEDADDTGDVTVEVAKSLLPDSYKGNPSLFASKVLEKLNGQWEDSSGYQTPNKRTHVTIKILRHAKPSHARRANPLPSVKQIIKQWLDLNLPDIRKLRIPIAAIPPSYLSHPEQLTYAIKRETETPIRIHRAKASWFIKRA